MHAGWRLARKAGGFPAPYFGSSQIVWTIIIGTIIIAAFAACMIIFVFLLFLPGTGTYATQCRKYFGDMTIEGVEIPFQMSSVEFFTLAKEHINPDGVMVVNMNMRGSKEGNINEYLADTIVRVFGTEYVVDVPG